MKVECDVGDAENVIGVDDAGLVIVVVSSTTCATVLVAYHWVVVIRAYAVKTIH
jgi:hypothetical protein